MKDLTIVRLSALLLGASIFFLYGIFHSSIALGVVFALAITAIMLLVETVFSKLSLYSIISSIIGLSLGLLFANLILLPLYLVHYEHIKLFVLLFNVVFGYTGLIIGFARSVNLSFADILRLLLKPDAIATNIKVLDTSALIDARIADIASIGFVEGRLIVPNFILNELQKIADSPDYLRRNKGKLGLETLQRLKALSSLHFNIIDDDFSDIKEIDSKLIAVARKYNAVIITTDHNLNKIATIQGIKVLNVNDLANALKPVIKQGDIITIFVSRHGKEQGQGVGFTEDGTMVVIEDAASKIGSTVEVVVNSLMQSSSGRIVFGKLKNA